MELILNANFETPFLIWTLEEMMELESDNEELAEEDTEVRVCDWRNCGADTSGLKDLVAHVNSKHVQVKSDIPFCL